MLSVTKMATNIVKRQWWVMWCGPIRKHWTLSTIKRAPFNFYSKCVKCSPDLIFGRNIASPMLYTVTERQPVLPIFCNYCILGKREKHYTTALLHFRQVGHGFCRWVHTWLHRSNICCAGRQGEMAPTTVMCCCRMRCCPPFAQSQASCMSFSMTMHQYVVPIKQWRCSNERDTPDSSVQICGLRVVQIWTQLTTTGLWAVIQDWLCNV